MNWLYWNYIINSWNYLKENWNYLKENWNYLDYKINSAPTESVAISDLNKISNQGDATIDNYEQPIELGSEEISNQNLYLKVYGFNSYDDAKTIIDTLNIDFKTTTQNEGDNYSILLGPLENIDANKLVSSFISKGYKNTEIILE